MSDENQYMIELVGEDGIKYGKVMLSNKGGICFEHVISWLRYQDKGGVSLGRTSKCDENNSYITKGEQFLERYETYVKETRKSLADDAEKSYFDMLIAMRKLPHDAVYTIEQQRMNK